MKILSASVVLMLMASSAWANPSDVHGPEATASRIANLQAIRELCSVDYHLNLKYTSGAVKDQVKKLDQMVDAQTKVRLVNYAISDLETEMRVGGPAIFCAFRFEHRASLPYFRPAFTE